MVKSCLYRGCKSHSDFINPDCDSGAMRFLPVPKPTTNIEKCERWLKAINRADITSVDVKQHHYVCSLHFVGGNGPTDQYPDPILDERLPTEYVVPVPRKKRTYKTYQKTGAIGVPSSTDAEPVVPIPIKTYSKTNRIALVSSSNRVERANVFGRVDSEQLQLESYNSFEKVTIKLEPIVHVQEGEAVDFKEITEGYSTPEPNFPVGLSIMQHITSNDIGTSPMSADQEDMATSPITAPNICNATLFDTLASGFLSYRAQHFRSINWCLKLKTENGVENLCFEQTVGSSSVSLNVSNNMNATISVSSKPLTDNHEFFQTLRDILSFPLSSLEDLLKILNGIDGATICQGIKGELFSTFQDKFLQTAEICVASKSLRSKKCQLVFASSRTELCQDCRMSKKILQHRIQRSKKNPVSPDNINHRFLSVPQIQQRVMNLQSKNSLLKRKIKVLESKVEKGIKREGIGIICEDSQELEDISKADPFKNPTSFLKLLLQEQLKILKSNICRPRKWHPAIIEWCSFMKTLSARSYEEMCNVLILPSEGTLSKKSKEIDAEIGHGHEEFLMTSFRMDFGNIQELEEHSSEIIDESLIESDSV